MKLSRFAPLFAFAIAATACSGSPATAPANQQEGAVREDKLASADDHFLRMAKDLDLTDAQKTLLRAIAEETRAKGVDIRSARKELMLAVATAVEKNNLDDASVGAKMKILSDAIAKHQRDIAESMNKVHAALTPAQRAKVADRIAKGGPFGAPGEHGPHGEHGKNHGGERGEHGKDQGGDGGHKHARGDAAKGLKEFADRLELTTDQKTHVRDAMRASFAEHKKDGADWKAKGQAMRDKAKRISEAFTQEKFDAVALGVGDHTSQGATAMAQHRIDMAKILSKELTPEQRTKFATVLRERAETSRF